MKLCLTDTRNPEKWTRADRNRKCDAAIVSSRWTRNPFGVRDVRVMPSLQPGILYFDGKPADLHGYNGSLLVALERIPGWDQVAGAPISIWKSGDGRQELCAFDVSNVKVVEAWAETASESFPWANEFHLDYFTDLAWLAPDRPAWAWKGWDAGYALFCKFMAFDRAYSLIGQQFHTTAITPYVDELYVEEHPQRAGILMADQSPTPDRIYEIRHGWTVPPAEAAAGITDAAWQAYVRACLRWIKEKDCYLSWGRDETAGVGL